MYKIYFSPLFFPASLPAEDVLPLTEENEIMTLHFLYCHRMSCKNFSQCMIWTDFLILHGEQIVKYKVKIPPASMMGSQASQLASYGAWFEHLPGCVCLPCVLMFNSNSSFSFSLSWPNVICSVFASPVVSAVPWI